MLQGSQGAGDGRKQGTWESHLQAIASKRPQGDFTCRSKDVADITVNELKESTKNHKVDYILGDLSLIQSAYALAESTREKFPIMTFFLHNAGL